MLNLQFSVSFFLRIEVEEEIRKQVDELMRQELKNLKMVCSDRGVIHFVLHMLLSSSHRWTVKSHTQSKSN